MSNPNILSDLKIIKRHNAAGVFVGILCLLSAAAPIFLWLYPWFMVNISGINPGESSIAFESGSVVLNAIHLFMNLFNKPGIGTSYISSIGYTSYQIRENILTYYLVKENLYAAAVWYGIGAFSSLILIIYGLVFLFRGRVKNFTGLNVFAFFYFLSIGMYCLDAFRLGWYLKYTIQKSCDISGMSVEKYVYDFLPSIIAAGVAFLIWFIILLIYIGGFRKRYYQEDIEIVEIEVPEPYERNNGAIRNTLPPYITNLGNHEYSKNTYLEIATIPDGITSIGIGAFSNCLKLKLVTIPKSVTRIGSNAFFHCPKLQRVNYGGTKEEWSHISRGTNWLSRSGTTTVVCIDGPISVNPYH